MKGIKIKLLSDLLLTNVLFQKYKINEIVNKLLLGRDNSMPEIHLRQPGFTYSACGPFTKNAKT